MRGPADPPPHTCLKVKRDHATIGWNPYVQPGETAYEPLDFVLWEKNQSLICLHHHLVSFCFMELKGIMANTHAVFRIANKCFKIWELLDNHLNKFLHITFYEGSIHVKAITWIQYNSFHLRVGKSPLNNFISYYYEISLICFHFLSNCLLITQGLMIQLTFLLPSSSTPSLEVEERKQ